MKTLESIINEKENLINEYISPMGEGETVATQIVTAVNKIVGRWQNDGDVYDNTNISFEAIGYSCCACANWLYENVAGAKILDEIFKITNEREYESILCQMLETFIVKDSLEEMNKIEKVGSIYHPLGNHFSINEYSEEEEYEEEY